MPTSPEITPQPAPGDSSTAGLVALAKADLAARLGINSADIQLVSVETQELPLQDLGCLKNIPTTPIGKSALGGNPEPVVPGIVMGQVIRLTANEQIYEFRGFGRRLVLCRSE